MRGQAWPLLVGNRTKVTARLFEHYKSYSYAASFQQAQNDQEGQQARHLIDVDIPRTFPDLNNLFEQVASLSESLRELLIAFSHMRPDVGYVQGMAHIAGNMLLHCGTPQDCFMVFANLVSLPLLHDFYTIDSIRIKITYKVFWRLLRQTSPILFENLITEPMVSCSIFLLGWVLTLFSAGFEISVASAMWDQIFLFGQDHVMRISLAVCKIVEEKALRAFHNMTPEK